MLHQIIRICVIILLLNNVSCKKKISLNNKIENVIKNKEYILKIETSIIRDTLDVVDYKEDKYSSPIIISQNLFFFSKNKLIKKIHLKIPKILKKTINGKELEVAQTPIYKMCTSNDLYIIQGSDYCNGSECAEFMGIYSRNGDVLFEGLSNKNDVLKDIIFKNKIDINNSIECVDINVFN